MGKLTKARAEALRWFSARSALGRVTWFDATAPSERMRQALIRDGLLDQKSPASGVGMVTYALTEAGRLALQEQDK